MSRLREGVGLGVGAFALLMCSCRRQSTVTQGAVEPVDLTALPGNTFEVTYNNHTVIMDAPSVRKTLRSVSKNGNVLVFDSSPEIQKLEPGSVLLMQGLALRKILAAMPFESRHAVLTPPSA